MAVAGTVSLQPITVFLQQCCVTGQAFRPGLCPPQGPKACGAKARERASEHG